MIKKTAYTIHQEDETHYANESYMSYSAKRNSEGEFVRSTREEVFKGCITLEESKRRLTEKISSKYLTYENCIR
jgi:hypothetical protein